MTDDLLRNYEYEAIDADLHAAAARKAGDTDLQARWEHVAQVYRARAAAILDGRRPAASTDNV